MGLDGFIIRICNNYCFSTVTVVARTDRCVTFIRTLPVLLVLNQVIHKVTSMF